jgi:hypothetical protein
MRRTPGRKLRSFDVQFDIHRKLAYMTLGAQIVGAGHAHRTDDGQDGFAVRTAQTQTGGKLLQLTFIPREAKETLVGRNEKLITVEVGHLRS